LRQIRPLPLAAISPARPKDSSRDHLFVWLKANLLDIPVAMGG
jgi:hypothetical protein